MKPASKDGAAPPAPKAPDVYKLTIPEGAETYLDATDLKALETRARAKGLTNEQAQAVVTEHVETIAAQSAAYRAETEADATYGGDRLKETQRLANLALDRMAPVGDPQGDALRRDLVRSGFGNKLSVLAALSRLGKLMAEDGPLTGSPAGGRRDDKQAVADALYPTTVGLK